MSVSQAEYAAFKVELSTAATAVQASLAKMEAFAIRADTEVAAAKVVIADLQVSYNNLAAQAAPAVDLRALYDATRIEVDELKRRALEVETKSSDKKPKWELSRPKDMDPTIFSGKEEAWPKFKEELMDYADAVHPGIKLQLEYTLKA